MTSPTFDRRRGFEVVPCGCGGDCGLTFERRHRKQVYAKNCPVRAERQLEAARVYERDRYRRKRGTTRQCKCGGNCGLTFEAARGRWYAPNCPVRAEKLLALGRTPVTGRSEVFGCRLCAGLAHRRQQPACPACGQPFRELEPLRVESFLSNRFLDLEPR